MFLIFLLAILGFSLISCNENGESEFLNIDKTYVRVTLSGEVERTGTYDVPRSWTLQDLFKYAGITRYADTHSFDLSSLVEDESIYVIPREKLHIVINDKVNLNTASKQELMSVSGIGNVIANNIINYRKTSPFKSVEEVENVSGVGNAVYEKIKNFITV